MAARVTGASERPLPLRGVLGTPAQCLDAALELALSAEAVGELTTAESILRGLCALDETSTVAAGGLARVLLARAIASADRDAARDAVAWARYACALTPSDAQWARLSARAERVSDFLDR